MIRNTEDANKYYQLVNQYIDEYVDKWKIKPTNLKNYLLGNKSKIVGFIERKGLKDIGNINQVLLDVVDDRISMYKDNVIKFESFKILESDEFKILEMEQCLYKGLGKASIDHEKFLADYFDVSLSQIDIVSPDRHVFNIEDREVIIYLEEDLKIINENVKEYLVNKILNKPINIEDSIKIDLSISIKDLITSDILKEKIDSIFDLEKVFSIIEQLLGISKDNKENDTFVGIELKKGPHYS